MEAKYRIELAETGWLISERRTMTKGPRMGQPYWRAIKYPLNLDRAIDTMIRLIIHDACQDTFPDGVMDDLQAMADMIREVKADVKRRYKRILT